MRRPKTLRNKLGHLALWLLFVIATTAVWIGHALNSVRPATIQVGVNYLGIEDDLALSGRLPGTFGVRVRDIGSRIRDLSLNRPQITLDLRDQTFEEQGEIVITQDIVRHALSDQLPGTMRVQDVQPDVIRVEYYREEGREKPIDFDIHIQPASQYVTVGEMAVSRKTVMVYGPKDRLKKIQSIRTAPTDIRDARRDIDCVIRLECPEGVRLQSDTISIHQQMDQYTERRFDCPITVVNAPDNCTMLPIPSYAVVTAHVLMSQYNQVSAEDIRLECNYKFRTDSLVPLQAISTHPGIIHMSHPTDIRYSIQYNE